MRSHPEDIELISTTSAYVVKFEDKFYALNSSWHEGHDDISIIDSTGIVVKHGSELWEEIVDHFERNGP